MIRNRSGRIGKTILALCVGVLFVSPTNPNAAHAGNVEWSFEVLEVRTLDDGANVIRLRPVPHGNDFPRSCETFIVHSFYDIEEWSRAGRKLAPRSGHERSLQMLLQAQVLHTLIRLRSAGRGFGSAPEAPECEVTSRALTFAPDPGGIPVIFSFYEDPRPER